MITACEVDLSETFLLQAFSLWGAILWSPLLPAVHLRTLFVVNNGKKKCATNATRMLFNEPPVAKFCLVKTLKVTKDFAYSTTVYAFIISTHALRRFAYDAK